MAGSHSRKKRSTNVKYDAKSEYTDTLQAGGSLGDNLLGSFFFAVFWNTVFYLYNMLT